jgi:hypothetical protein
MTKENIRELDHVDDTTGNIRTIKQFLQIKQIVVRTTPPEQTI